MSRWERLRRPSAASSTTSGPNFSEASRTSSAHSSTVTSPTTPAFPLPPAAAPSHDMMRTVSDDSYMHILAASAAAAQSSHRGGRSLRHGFAAIVHCSPQKGSTASVAPMRAVRQQRICTPLQARTKHRQEAGVARYTFHKLSARLQSAQEGRTAGTGVDKPVKPHFLDLSSIICPTPAHSDAQQQPKR